MMHDDAPPSSRVDLNDEIAAVEALLMRAQLLGDVVALDRLIDERLLFVGPDGVVATKQ
ncbi:MAG: nuclear transport factor 2 family protein, partial [Myxococcales bacterium]